MQLNIKMLEDKVKNDSLQHKIALSKGIVVVNNVPDVPPFSFFRVRGVFSLNSPFNG